MRPSWISEWHSFLLISQGKYQSVLWQLKQRKQWEHKVFKREGGNFGASRLQHYHILLGYPEIQFQKPWALPSLLCKGYQVFPGVKRQGCGVEYPPQSRAEFKERVLLYLYSTSGPWWPVLWWALPLPFTISETRGVQWSEIRKSHITLNNRLVTDVVFVVAVKIVNILII